MRPVTNILNDVKPLASGTKGVGRLALDARARRDLIAGRDYPRTYREFVNWCHDDEACAVYPEKFALANRIQVPSMRGCSRSLEADSGSLGVFELPPPDVGHCRDDSRQDADSSDDVV